MYVLNYLKIKYDKLIYYITIINMALLSLNVQYMYHDIGMIYARLLLKYCNSYAVILTYF